jgi:hypothetical protein
MIIEVMILLIRKYLWQLNEIFLYSYLHKIPQKIIKGCQQIMYIISIFYTIY